MSWPTTLACQTEDADLWFAERPEALARAQALCMSCPVRRDCLTEAVRRQEPWGVWGGQIFQDGVVVAYRRGRGRPRTRPITRVGAARADRVAEPSVVWPPATGDRSGGRRVRLTGSVIDVRGG
jgi:WhiB family redox-sensing transcriptional regulator